MWMQTIYLAIGLLASSLSVAPPGVPVSAPSCGTSEMYWFIGEHAVCGWAPWVDLHDVHCDSTAGPTCGSHAWCHEQDAMAAEPVLGQLLRGEADVSADELREALHKSDRIVLNSDRGAVQILSCGGSDIVAHIPLETTLLRILAQ